MIVKTKVSGSTEYDISFAPNSPKLLRRVLNVIIKKKIIIKLLYQNKRMNVLFFIVYEKNKILIPNSPGPGYSYSYSYK